MNCISTNSLGGTDINIDLYSYKYIIINKYKYSIFQELFLKLDKTWNRSYIVQEICLKF